MKKSQEKIFGPTFFLGPHTCLNATLEDLLAFSSRHTYIILVGLFFEILKISPLISFFREPLLTRN